MTNKHTPGPWKQTDADMFGMYIEAVVDGRAVPVACALDMDDKPVEVIEANANLIEAAPDLLAALREIARDDGDVSALEAWADDEAGRQWFARARDAIAKAYGGQRSLFEAKASS